MAREKFRWAKETLKNLEEELLKIRKEYLENWDYDVLRELTELSTTISNLRIILEIYKE